MVAPFLKFSPYPSQAYSPGGGPGEVLPIRDALTRYSFSFSEKKRNQKKPPVSRLTLRVVDTAGARGNSPRFQRGSDSPRAFIRPYRRCSARHKGNYENQRTKTVLSLPIGSYPRRPVWREKLTPCCGKRAVAAADATRTRPHPPAPAGCWPETGCGRPRHRTEPR